MEKNLQSREALDKFKELVNDINVCMFITNNNEMEHTRPMATIEVDEEGTLWFFTDIRSIKVDEVERDQRVHLVYSHPGKHSYLNVWGQAELITDRQQIVDKWSPIVKAWFPDGAGDPNLALLKVRPEDAYYWDSETGRMVQFLKMAAAVITGKKLAEGAQGGLKL